MLALLIIFYRKRLLTNMVYLVLLLKGRVRCLAKVHRHCLIKIYFFSELEKSSKLGGYKVMLTDVFRKFIFFRFKRFGIFTFYLTVSKTMKCNE